MKLLIEYNVINEAFAKADLINAIKGKKAIRISYDTEIGKRLIEPRVVGRTIAGNMAVRAFQISGPTKTENNQWKIFLFSKINGLELTDQDISNNRPKYNPHGDEMFTEVMLQN